MWHSKVFLTSSDANGSRYEQHLILWIESHPYIDMVFLIFETSMASVAWFLPVAGASVCVSLANIQNASGFTVGSRH